ncbi:hypothetical protein LTR47_009129 [Exophiala xenobiotica]|nr:hypothetical protein LTR72_003504 [Exophiala xenobiotica]KAK5226451.1 hypothetical protein LTR47_009129 [Exophiala xenobiotica]KAK5284482.1 hypothetical protein LTR40_000152 [Exophiala xenobiotica]KAK5298421.1 hypothetical protein LTR14_002272 [Exophiala xenobiotica]KAK5353483.1 hypothetical protein LTR61_003441 [Exophiala xenobiotica]
MNTENSELGGEEPMRLRARNGKEQGAPARQAAAAAAVATTTGEGEAVGAQEQYPAVRAGSIHQDDRNLTRQRERTKSPTYQLPTYPNDVFRYGAPEQQ